MSAQNIPKKSARFSAIVLDVTVVGVYIGFLLTGAFLVVMNLGDRPIPHIEVSQAKLFAALAMVPLPLLFILLDYFAGGSIGKLIMGPRVSYQTRAFWRSIVRNIVKFLPFAMYGASMLLYDNFQEKLPYVTMLQFAAFLFGAALLATALLEKEGRHLGDMLAGTRVVAKRRSAIAEDE